jgi:hypothetical protein
MIITVLLGAIIVVAAFVALIVLLWLGFDGRGPVDGIVTALLGGLVWFIGCPLGLLVMTL